MAFTEQRALSKVEVTAAFELAYHKALVYVLLLTGAVKAARLNLLATL